MDISIPSRILTIKVSPSRTIRMPLESGLIFSFAGSVLVSRREQLLL
jgi:hypothetical protein